MYLEINGSNYRKSLISKVSFDEDILNTYDFSVNNFSPSKFAMLIEYEGSDMQNYMEFTHKYKVNITINIFLNGVIEPCRECVLLEGEIVTGYDRSSPEWLFGGFAYLKQKIDNSVEYEIEKYKKYFMKSIDNNKDDVDNVELEEKRKKEIIRSYKNHADRVLMNLELDIKGER